MSANRDIKEHYRTTDASTTHKHRADTTEKNYMHITMLGKGGLHRAGNAAKMSTCTFFIKTNYLDELLFNIGYLFAKLHYIKRHLLLFCISVLLLPTIVIPDDLLSFSLSFHFFFFTSQE